MGRCSSEGASGGALARACCLALGTLGLACQPGAATDGDSAAVEPPPPMGNLLIEEVYYSGAVPAAGNHHTVLPDPIRPAAARRIGRRPARQ